MQKIVSRLSLWFVTLFLIYTPSLMAQQPEYYQMRVYKMTSNEQVNITEQYIQQAYLPALHRNGIGKIGVFKPIDNDTARTKALYVLIPMLSLEQLPLLEDLYTKDALLQKAGAAYFDLPYNTPPYQRLETSIMRAFRDMPSMQVPALKGEPSQRIYELRSYEGATEALYRRKVHMFNEGGEIKLFERLGFNAVFYAEVLAGSNMPNLVYMTSFDNIASREQHWKDFGKDPEWIRISTMPYYQHTVSKADIILLHPSTCSEW